MAAFTKSTLNFRYFEKEDDTHGFCILEITDSMPKRPGFRGPLEKQHGRRAQALLKSASQHLYHIYWSLASQLSWKKSLFLTCKILGLILNTLAADDRYPVLNKDNLTIPTQIQLSRKQQTFSQFSATFLISSCNLKHFEKKDDPSRFCISEITDSENVVI